MPTTHTPALFRALPELEGRISHQAFLDGPTPVAPFTLRGLPRSGVFVKRDDRCCLLYGGNKPRKLEFTIGAARARGSRRLVTVGALGTHHGLATTILGRAAGLKTSLVLVDQPLTDEVVRSLELQAAFGAQQLYAGGNVAAALWALAALTRASAGGERPTPLWIGGSSAQGNLGFVSAAFELRDQVRAGELPEPAEIFVPVGSGGTLAGLVLGLRLAGLPARVIGVLVTDILPPSPEKLRRMALRSWRLLRRCLPALPRPALAARDFRLVRDQLGPGYGAATPAARAAQEDAAARGLPLDLTYSAKCLAALRARGTRATARGPVLFWNTYNAIDVRAAAPVPPDRRLLPRRLQRALDRRGR